MIVLWILSLLTIVLGAIIILSGMTTRGSSRKSLS